MYKRDYRVDSPRDASRQGLGRQGFIPAPLPFSFFPLRTRVFFSCFLLIKTPAGDKTRLQVLYIKSHHIQQQRFNPQIISLLLAIPEYRNTISECRCSSYMDQNEICNAWRIRQAYCEASKSIFSSYSTGCCMLITGCIKIFCHF